MLCLRPRPDRLPRPEQQPASASAQSSSLLRGAIGWGGSGRGPSSRSHLLPLAARLILRRRRCPLMGRPVLGSPVSVSDIHGGSVLDWTRQTSARVHVFHDRVELGLERAAVPVVLDSVVTPPRQHLGYVHPLVAVQTASSEHSVSDCPQAGRGRARQISAPVSMNESLLLFNVPRTLPHSWVEVIEPAASARASGQQREHQKDDG